MDALELFALNIITMVDKFSLVKARWNFNTLQLIIISNGTNFLLALNLKSLSWQFFFSVRIQNRFEAFKRNFQKLSKL